jgi:SMODS-associated and fused to various effectors sensor domain
VLVSGRDSRTKLLLPVAAEQTSLSARGKARAAWAREAGLTEEQLLEMLSILRFDTARDLPDVETTTSLLMQVAGFLGDPCAVRDGANWVAQQVRDGKRYLDIDMIKEAVKELDLHQGPSRAVLSVATLMPDPLLDQAIHSLDWHERFDGADAYAKRRPAPPATWKNLQDDIEAVPRSLGAVNEIAVTGSIRQATAFMIGAALRMVTNVDVAVTQRHQLWASTASYDQPLEPAIVEHHLGQGDDIAIAVEVATKMADDVLEYLRSEQLPVDRLIVLRPPAGPKDNSIPDSTVANALAVGIRDQARRSVRRHGRVHLFLAGPMGLALLLGHRWNRVAPTVVYEEVLTAVQYEPAFTVSA